jgi:hypothetical protein
LEVPFDMLHFTCDLCGKDIDTGAATRYVLKMEVFAAGDPTELTPADLDQDPIESLSEALKAAEVEGTDPGEELAPARKSFRYDLCAECHRKFLQDPLAREAEKKFHFSEN